MELILLVILLEQSVGVGVVDTPIHAGRLSLSEHGFEFRPCDSDQILFVDASVQIISNFDKLLQSQSSAPHEPIYIRFQGKHIAQAEGQSDQYSGAIRILEVLFSSATIPIHCK